jgi:hypothetical protein
MFEHKESIWNPKVSFSILEVINATEPEKKLESNLFSSTISSSNLQIAIDKALKMSSNLSEFWASGDLPQKKKIQSLVFPSGIGYDKLKGKVQTKRVNSIFSAIPLLSKDLAKIKSGEPVDFNQFSARVTPTGESSNFMKDFEELYNY